MQSATPNGFSIRLIFVQIKCVRAQAYAVAADLVDNVAATSEVYSTSGSFDLLAKFTITGLQDRCLFVTETLQGIAGIADTCTIIGFNPFTPQANPGQEGRAAVHDRPRGPIRLARSRAAEAGSIATTARMIRA